jgi:hypothetical protein
MNLKAWYTKNQWTDTKQVMVVGVLPVPTNQFSPTNNDFRVVCVDQEGDMFLASPHEIKISNSQLLFKK